ncbi:hypothetical protein CASFOL_003201 [Castilleja foliolosa]|uniref:Pentatricopeptide repeat-containing protein n=1 Tax=Castilleja foliolosa TaxID=1961234 RepID=A0ABD3EGG9_9LAMI
MFIAYSMFPMELKRVQVLSVSKRLISATAISQPPPPRTFPPPHCNLSPQFTSAGDEKISFSGTASANDSLNLFASKEEKIDCYFKTSALNLIDVSKLLEVEKVSIMLYKCKTIKQLKHIHLRMLINGLRDDDNCNYLAEKVMLLASDLISFDYAYNVFMYLSSNPNISSYNILIKSSIGKSDYIAASAYNNNQDNISPDRFTFGFLFKSFASSDWLKGGEMMHAHVIKMGFVSDTFVMNSLLELYFKFVESESRNQLRAVWNVFDEMPERDIVSWNAMISGLVYYEFFSEALSVFDDMLLLADHRCKPDETTLINIIKACSRMELIEQGKWLDAYIKENKLVLSLPLGNALINMFLSYNDLGNMKVVFKSMSRRCIFTWRSMLKGLERNSFCKEALLLFDTMCCCSEEEDGVKPDDDIFDLVLASFYRDMSLLGDGKRLFRVIHKMVHGFGVKPGKSAYNFMISILAEAGWVEAAMMLAESLPWEPSEYVWGYLLYKCQIHGNENLMDSWIRKINEVKSKQDDQPYIRMRHCFMKSTLVAYIHAIIGQRHNDVNYVELMVDSLITKLPEQKLVDWLNKYMRKALENKASSEAYNHRQDRNKYAHTEARPRFEDGDDVCKLLKSLNRQLLDFHDQMISITDDPCQLAI